MKVHCGQNAVKHTGANARQAVQRTKAQGKYTPALSHVSNLQCVAFEEQVRRLQVSVRDGLGQRVEVAQPLAQLQACALSLLRISEATWPLDPLLQCLVAELHHDVNGLAVGQLL